MRPAVQKELIEGVLIALDLLNIDVAKAVPELYNEYLMIKQKATNPPTRR